MKTSGPARAHRNSFTLIEMLVSMAILSLLLIVFATMLTQTSLAWSANQQRLENFQNGRAIIEIMARELAPAAISPSLQFVQNPTTSGKSDLTALLPTSPAVTQATNSDSLFWARPATQNSYGNMYETGYYLTTVASTPKKYELVRFNVAPGSEVTSLTAQKSHGSNSTNWIYDPPTAYNPEFPILTSWPEFTDAPWLTTLSAAQFQPATSVVSDGVIAFWIRCLDKNGDPIPWLYQSSLYSSIAPFSTTTPNLKFNSAAAFNPATLGSPSSFTYTMPPTPISINVSAVTSPSGTVAANRLPSAVELTIVTLDSRTLARPGLTLPAIPASTSATDVPNEIQTFMNSLLTKNIKTAKVFSTTVRLVNGTE